jgi:hypothetical protein
MLAPHVQDEVLQLKGKLIGVAIGTAASVGQTLNPTLVVAIEDFVLRETPNSLQSSAIG